MAVVSHWSFRGGTVSRWPRYGFSSVGMAERWLSGSLALAAMHPSYAGVARLVGPWLARHARPKMRLFAIAPAVRARANGTARMWRGCLMFRIVRAWCCDAPVIWPPVVLPHLDPGHARSMRWTRSRRTPVAFGLHPRAWGVLVSSALVQSLSMLPDV